MASGAYMRIKGFQYGLTRKNSNRREWIPLETIRFATASPEGARGKQTGRRIHDTVKLAKFIDKTTPLILQALCSEGMEMVEFVFRGSVRERNGTRPMLRCKVGKAVVVKRKVKPPPKGGSGREPGTEELTLRCSNLLFCTND